jgi:hypothetical protein
VNWWVFGGVVVGIAALGYLGQRFGMFDLIGKNKAKSAGNGASMMGIGDEIFAPARHEAQVELDRQTILPAPAPLAGDRPSVKRGSGAYDGQIRIDLPSRQKDRD